jgi:hypothetical protein
VRHARDRLLGVAPGVLVAGGTKLFFAEINRNPPDCAAIDGLVLSINPQVHACDDTSLIENLEAQADVVHSARAICGDLPIFISPITFVGRDGPFAAGPAAPGSVPGHVDMRQVSLFGAGWTTGSVRYLATSGAAALTYYETTGWLGLMERAAGSPMPDHFPSTPGMVYPIYLVFADLGEWKRAQMLELHTSDSLIADGLAVRAHDGVHVIVANLTDEPRTVNIGPFSGDQVRIRVLDEGTAPLALTDPERFRSTGSVLALTGGQARVTLAPFAVARFDPVVEP